VGEAVVVTIRRWARICSTITWRSSMNGPSSTNPNWDACYCWFPHHDPAAGEWTARTGAQNREAVTAAITNGTMSGYMACADGQVVGWCNAAPRDRYPTLAELPGDGASVGFTPCFIVDPAWRGRGVGRRLLQAAVEGLAADGMERLQGAPIRDAATPAERHRGTIEVFKVHGYERVADLPDGTSLMEQSLSSRRPRRGGCA
jgi:GNAT superfamily N-acetyltransferase